MAHKVPIISEKAYKYKGLFDLTASYNYVKTFLDDYKHYDVTEKESDEKNSNGTREFDAYFEALFEYNDYYLFTITFEMVYKGVEITAEDSKGKSHTLIDGTASIMINSYLTKDHLHQKKHGPLFEFLEKVYKRYVDDEHHHAIEALAKDTGQLLNRFKQSLNSSIK